jgi:mannosyl-oligosaccharide alpha-1,2-mannosidase
MLLPIHRLPSSDLNAGFSKRPSFLLNKRGIIRWIACACIAIAFIWFGGSRLVDPLSLVPSESELEYPPNSATAPHLNRPLKPPPQPTKEEQGVWETRKNEVRNAFKHAWSGYKSIAYPNDELMSLSGGTSNKLRSYFPFLSFN